MASIAPPVPQPQFRWPFWPVLPLYPYGQRRTLRREVVPDTVWIFDQYQGIFYVVVPIRMTVVRLGQGGLLVYAPVAPTPECMALLTELVDRHGPVRYILMTTATGIEHKVFVGPFARCCPQAQVLVAPHQWSYPLNLPLPWLGVPERRTQPLSSKENAGPLAEEFDLAILGPIPLGLGPFVEVALFHRPSRTLMLTDSLVSIPAEPPPVLALDPYPLLFHSRDRATDPWVDTPAARRQGWQRIALFAFYFRPDALEVPPLGAAWRQARQAPDRSRRAYFGLYPFQWRSDWQASFHALHRGGEARVAPILQTLIFNRGPALVADWVDTVCRWQFERVIPCHLTAPLTLTPAQFRRAFTFLQGTNASPSPDLTAADLTFLEEIEADLVRRGITPPRQEPCQR